MRLEVLFQFIVPLTFLAIWALTSLLNRDAQPLPPRPGRTNGPGGQRPAPGDEAGVDPRTRQTSTFTTRPAPGQDPRLGPRPGNRDRAGQRNPASLDDAIVYLESTTSSSQRGVPLRPGQPGGSSTIGRKPGGGGLRRSARGKQSTAPGSPPTRPGEVATHRALTESVNKSLALQKSHPLEIAPLAPLAHPLSQMTPVSVVTKERPMGDRPSMTGDELRAMMTGPARLKEVALLSELMQPPVALRRHRKRL